MKTRLTKNAVALTLGLILAASVAQEAKADLRVRGTLHTPNLEIRVGYPGGGPVLRHSVPVRTVTPRDRWARHLSPWDFDVAFRLSYLTGFDEHRLLRMRADGLSWKRVARVLDIPRPVLHAAQSHDAFERYLEWNDRYDDRGRGRGGRGHDHGGKCGR